MKKIVILMILMLALPASAGRDSGGTFTYSPNAGNVVAPATTISSTWANQSFLDVKSALTDSLSRSGLGSMSAPLTLVDSTTDTLDLRWLGALTTGFYLNGGELGLKIAGSPYQKWTAALVTIPTSVNITAAGGTNAIEANGNVIINSGDVQVTSGGVNLLSGTFQTITKTVGGDLYISHAVAGGNIQFTTPISVGGAGAVRFGIMANNTIMATVPLTMGNQLISNVLTPVSPTDVATKAYVDSGARPLAAPTWTAITVSGTAGCTAGTGTDAPAYAIYDGAVYLRGTAYTTSNGAQCSLATLPAGYRPSSTKIAFSPTGGQCCVLSSAGAWTCGTESGGPVGCTLAAWQTGHVINLSLITYPAEG